ncbi:hypothetical protein M9458_010951, partial [Cirrhinus mrigala]
SSLAPPSVISTLDSVHRPPPEPPPMFPLMPLSVVVSMAKISNMFDILGLDGIK